MNRTTGRQDLAGGPARDPALLRDLDHERAATREATARLAAVVDSSIDGILTKDLTGRITSWNAACQRMFGYTAEEAVGQPITILYPKGKEAEEEAILRRIRAGKPVRIREAERVRKDGSRVWVSVSASPLRDADGKIVGAAAIKRDVTGERAMERERREAEERFQELSRLQDINRFKTRFINTAAHELRTPLLPLRTQLDLLMTDEAEPPTPSQARAMEVMRRNLERLGGLVEDLLTIARSEAGRIELDLQEVDLALLLRSAAERSDAAATQQGVALSIQCPTHLTVVADSKRVSQVLSNLLENAFKFTPAGGTVQLRAVEDGDVALVSVADSGRGIAKAQLAHLFQPFVQVHDMAITEPGSGLGLYICKQIVELHGGTIGARSPGLGRGSTFWFTLPRPARNGGRRPAGEGAA